ncbi:hypothetical protein MPSEU_000322500 [Mayamaea pseudoterrestris]|nr:hypothetical protein MPSEU_000322500 [Mayamaea pseudoterrestris]
MMLGSSVKIIRIARLPSRLRASQLGLHSTSNFASSSYRLHAPTSSSRSSSTLTNDDYHTESSNRKELVEASKFLFSPVQKQVMSKCREMHASIMPLNERLRGPLSPQSDQGTALPFVFLVGNHSSGKSSFINYVLGRKIQTSGVAPTDDSFTVIAPGPSDRDQDGPALIGDPDLGFSQLRQFGPTLMHHTTLKIRSNIDSNFIICDSPGMIDAPANYLMAEQRQQGSISRQAGGAAATSTMDRGYDFTGVVSFLADRADIVLLFFDPDKPGTTGETLSTLLHSLSGMDHKLLIVLNKADQFKKIHDFARAYGSLCWNLSKVIPRKDLPRIYTMCLPVAENVTEEPPAGLQDLHTARDEVVAEVRKAPSRRMDNVLTHLHDSVLQLRMHATILKDIRQRWSKLYWQSKWQELGVALTGGGLTTALTMYGGDHVSMSVTGSILAATIVGTGGLTWFHSAQLQEWERQASRPEELSAAFQRTHARAISDGDEYTAAVWQRIRDHLRIALTQTSISDVPTVSDADLYKLQSIVDQDIPDLRRTISPQHYGKSDD